MNKIITILWPVIIITMSCSKIDRAPMLEESSVSLVDDSFEVGYDAALRVALTYSEGKELSSLNPYVFQGDTAFFIANFSDGWCIISNDQRTSPVLANADTGNLYLEDSINTNLRFWLEAALGYVCGIENECETKSETASNLKFWENIPEIKAKKRIKGIKTKDLFDSLYTFETYAWRRTFESRYLNTSVVNSQIGPLTQTEWGQDSPWNNELPDNCPAGSTPVAVAQIFYYLHNAINVPSGLYHNVSVSSYQTGDYNHYYCVMNVSGFTDPSSRWNDMPLTSSGNNTSYVGDLLLYIGNTMGTAYAKTGSYTVFSPTVFTNNHIAYSSCSYNLSTVYSSLSYGLPLIIGAHQNTSDEICWIIDGRVNRTDYYTDYYRWYRLSPTDPMSPPVGTEYFTEEEALSIDPYIYEGKIMQIPSSLYQEKLLMNWGMNGNYNNAEYNTSIGWNPNGFGAFYSSPVTIYYDFHWMSYIQ